jgi:hypothetical protein
MSFADDFNIAKTSPSLIDIETALNEDLVKIAKWSKRKRLRISTETFHVVYFTHLNREQETPKIYYEGVLISVTKTMKSLGILFDSTHTMTSNLKASSSKGRGRVPIIKAVMGADWGFTLEDALLTYKSLIAPVIGFGTPIFLPLRADLKSVVAPLQLVQNACLHAITGCHSATSIQHLHNECQMLLVEDHLSIQCSQFLENTNNLHTLRMQ